MRWLCGLILLLVAAPGWAEGRIPSDCIALSAAEPGVVPVRFDLPDNQVRIRFVQHASFAIESSGLLVVTDYAGELGPAKGIPDVVTMNNAHDTHFTDHPDPRIPLVLRGWGPGNRAAEIDVDLGEMRVRNVTTDLRGPFGEGARKDGNSIFIFEVAGLCIGHLSHLHQIPTPAQYAAIGRLDVVMVPVDGAFTLNVAAMADIVRHLHPRVVLPMHWFSDEGLARFLVQLKDDYTIAVPGSTEILVSRDSSATATRRSWFCRPNFSTDQTDHSAAFLPVRASNQIGNAGDLWEGEAEVRHAEPCRSDVSEPSGKGPAERHPAQTRGPVSGRAPWHMAGDRRCCCLSGLDR